MICQQFGLERPSRILISKIRSFAKKVLDR